MDRYAVISKGMSVSQMVEEVKRFGGRNIKVASLVGQVFCHMDDIGAGKLNGVPGLTVKKIKRVSTKYTDAQQVRAPTWKPTQAPVEVEATYSALQGSLVPYFYKLRDLTDPPVTGSGGTCVVLDSGIRKTHRGLRGKVVYEKNFSDSPTLEDIFDHGTGVAYVVAGGRHAAMEDSGIAPGCKVMNIKVLNDDGEGSEENVVLGLEEVVRLRRQAYEEGLHWYDDMFITGVNISFGAPDDGDPDNPMRVACRAAITEIAEETGVRLIIVAAAGNKGPNPGTVVAPSTEPEVLSIGVLTFSPFYIWPLSSRGPTKEGIIKPDLVWFGVNLNVASSASDDAFAVKSGSSFAAPYVIGGGFDAWELYRRVYGQEATLSTEAWFEWARTISVKPEGALAEKDNTYGWGMPWGSTLVQQIAGMAAPELVIGGLTDIVVPIMTLGMVGMMMAGMAKGMKV